MTLTTTETSLQHDMKFSSIEHCRRTFLRLGLSLTGGMPFAGAAARNVLADDAATAPSSAGSAAGGGAHGRVAIVPCVSYGTEVDSALRKSFDLLGGIGPLVKEKTVTVKVNLTGTLFRPFLGRPVGETFMTHYATARALAAALFDAGARRVRFVESTNSKASLEATLADAQWDVKALRALGRVEFENTRNLGTGKSYATMKVPTGGYLFSSFDFNHCYEKTDVMVSLCKLKQHSAAGVTLAMKNQFGLTPNSLYGSQAVSEEATVGRGPLHGAISSARNLSGFKPGANSPVGSPVARVIVDICAARPIHLAIIDGITAMSGGELPWAGRQQLTKAGILIAGFNPVSTDAVGTAAMGYSDPRAKRGTRPFKNCDNHLLLAEQAGLGTADLGKIEVLGLPLEKARYAYPDF